MVTLWMVLSDGLGSQIWMKSLIQSTISGSASGFVPIDVVESSSWLREC